MMENIRKRKEALDALEFYDSIEFGEVTLRVSESSSISMDNAQVRFDPEDGFWLEASKEYGKDVMAFVDDIIKKANEDIAGYRKVRDSQYLQEIEDGVSKLGYKLERKKAEK